MTDPHAPGSAYPPPSEERAGYLGRHHDPSHDEAAPHHGAPPDGAAQGEAPPDEDRYAGPPPSGWQPSYAQLAQERRTHGQPPYPEPSYGQSTYGEPTFGRPTYGEPASTEQGYGPPEHGGPAPWAYPAPPAPASHRRRTVLIAAVTAVVVLAAGLTVYFVTRKHDSTSAGRPTLPESFDGYQRLEDSTAERVENAMRGFLSGVGEGDATKNATIASYATGSAPELVVLVVPTGTAGFGGGDPQTAVQQILKVVPAASTFPTGSTGGALECGNVAFGAIQETLCAFSDDKYTGVLTSVQPALAPSAAAQVARALRAAVR